LLKLIDVVDVTVMMPYAQLLREIALENVGVPSADTARPAWIDQ
jgi:hypothetical protein